MPNCAVVVGAGSGTGAEVAKLLAAEGYSVVVARRDAASLAPLVARKQVRFAQGCTWDGKNSVFLLCGPENACIAAFHDLQMQTWLAAAVFSVFGGSGQSGLKLK